MMKAQWYKAKFTQKNGHLFCTETAVILAEDELQAMNFIREYCGSQFVESEVQPYCTTAVMHKHMLFNEEGTADYVMVAL